MDQGEFDNVISWDSIRFQKLHVFTAYPLTFVLGFCLIFFSVLYCFAVKSSFAWLVCICILS